MCVLLSEKVKSFAEESLINFFDTVEFTAKLKCWRQELRIQEEAYRISLGHLYENGGKRVTIEWDDNSVFKYDIRHFKVEEKEKFERSFEQFLKGLDMDCMWIQSYSPDLSMRIAAFGPKAATILEDLLQEKLLRYQFERRLESQTIRSFIGVWIDEKKVTAPIVLDYETGKFAINY